MHFKLLTYNILHGGKGRESLLLAILQKAQADVVILEEAEQIQTVREFAQILQLFMFTCNGIALLSKYPITATQCHRSFPRIHDSILEATLILPSETVFHLFAVHPIHYPGSFLDLWRNWQLRVVREYSKLYVREYCLIAGDFNAIGPADRVATSSAPFVMRLIYRLQRGNIYRSAIENMLRAGFIDCYRQLHPTDAGFTIPTGSPKVRLDYIFANARLHSTLLSCDVVTEPSEVHRASDHYPVIAEFEL